MLGGVFHGDQPRGSGLLEWINQRALLAIVCYLGGRREASRVGEQPRRAPRSEPLGHRDCDP
jgi:hypothetical protein